MEPRVVEFRTDKRFARRRREATTLEAMIAMHCLARHRWGGAPCPECGLLGDYARRRLERCVFGDAKPTCANCVVHCYREDMRERVREVMRWAGPRMLLRHPWLAVMHFVDGRRAAPALPRPR